ncbi:MAG: hypothetical protein H6817_02240 [Phycisphaerales bacterium]|nr:hypothetical protein [Phycisphaerales bacterium]
MIARRRRFIIVGLLLLVPLAGCGTAVRDGISGGVEDGIASAISSLVEVLIEATLGGNV